MIATTMTHGLGAGWKPLPPWLVLPPLPGRLPTANGLDLVGAQTVPESG